MGLHWRRSLRSVLAPLLQEFHAPHKKGLARPRPNANQIVRPRMSMNRNRWATSPPGTFLAELQNFKKFVGFSGLLDIM